jgi:hypothetical protein
MDATTMGRVRDDVRIGVGSAVAYIGAVAFVIAASWYILAVKSVTVASEPEFSAGLSEEEKLRIFFRWVVSTLPQERLYTSIAILGFLCLAATVIPVRSSISRGSSAALVGAFAVSTGATLWIVGNVVQLGAHRAVGVMVTHPAGSLSNASDLFFTADLIDDAFEVTAFAVIGVGMLALAAASFVSSTNRFWMGSTIAIGIVMPVTSITYLADQGDLTDLLLVLGGVVLLPAWLIATGRLLTRRLKLYGRSVPASSSVSSSAERRAVGGRVE